MKYTNHALMRYTLCISFFPLFKLKWNAVVLVVKSGAAFPEA